MVFTYIYKIRMSTHPIPVVLGSTLTGFQVHWISKTNEVKVKNSFKRYFINVTQKFVLLIYQSILLSIYLYYYLSIESISLERVLLIQMAPYQPI